MFSSRSLLPTVLVHLRSAVLPRCGFLRELINLITVNRDNSLLGRFFLLFF